MLKNLLIWMSSQLYYSSLKMYFFHFSVEIAICIKCSWCSGFHSDKLLLCVEYVVGIVLSKYPFWTFCSGMVSGAAERLMPRATFETVVCCCCSLLVFFVWTSLRVLLPSFSILSSCWLNSSTQMYYRVPTMCQALF